jgi:hypothetical protein
MLIQHNLTRTHRLVSCRSAGGLLDHLIGTGEQNRGQVEANSLCRRQVYGKFEAPGLLNRKIRRSAPFKILSTKVAERRVISTMSGPIRDQPSIFNKFSTFEHHRQIMFGSERDDLWRGVPPTVGPFGLRSNFFYMNQDHRSDRKSLQRFDHPTPWQFGAPRPPRNPAKPTTSNPSNATTLQTCTGISSDRSLTESAYDLITDFGETCRHVRFAPQ